MPKDRSIPANWEQNVTAILGVSRTSKSTVPIFAQLGTIPLPVKLIPPTSLINPVVSSTKLVKPNTLFHCDATVTCSIDVSNKAVSYVKSRTAVDIPLGSVVWHHASR